MGIWEDVGHDPCEEVVVVDRLNKKTEWLSQKGKSGCCEEVAIGDRFDCIQKLALTVSQQKTNYNIWVTQIFPLSHACDTNRLQLLIKKITSTITHYLPEQQQMHLGQQCHYCYCACKLNKPAELMDIQWSVDLLQSRFPSPSHSFVCNILEP